MADEALDVGNAELDELRRIIGEALETVQEDPDFKLKYVLKSLFLVGAGAFGCVFRSVTVATGPQNNPKYNEGLVRILKKLKQTPKATKDALLDNYRNDECLDLVAVKFEQLTQGDFDTNSVGKVNLVREFYLLHEMFNNADARYSMVGFPMPIEFSYIGIDKPAKALKSIIVYDPCGMQMNFTETYLEANNPSGIVEDDVRIKSYMTMELLGPNIDDWKKFFSKDDSRVYFSVQTTFKLMDQVLCRLLILHRNNIVHLDLKPDNICMGLGKMANTAYLLDFGLSRVCSDFKPEVTLGSRRYMSVGVIDFCPANYMMDIESWFYILIVLLTDYIPWSDQELEQYLGENEKEGGAREEVLQKLVEVKKKTFWDDNKHNDRTLFKATQKKISSYHKKDVPDIGKIFFELYEHIKKMRQDFSTTPFSTMNADIKHEESDLFKRYKSLRKLLLFVYNCNFSESTCCFNDDKDLQQKQLSRSRTYNQLIFCDNGGNWHWDWDLWYDEKYPE